MSERVDVVPSPLVGEGQGGGSWTAEFPLLGPAGELVDLRRVFLSHGITSLPPMRLDEKAWTFATTVPLAAVRMAALFQRRKRWPRRRNTSIRPLLAPDTAART